jgi:hypothetical protein
MEECRKQLVVHRSTTGPPFFADTAEGAARKLEKISKLFADGFRSAMLRKVATSVLRARQKKLPRIQRTEWRNLHKEEIQNL